MSCLFLIYPHAAIFLTHFLNLCWSVYLQSVAFLFFFILSHVIAVAESLRTLFLRITWQEGSDLESTNERGVGGLEVERKAKFSCHLKEAQGIFPPNQYQLLEPSSDSIFYCSSPALEWRCNCGFGSYFLYFLNFQVAISTLELCSPTSYNNF